MLTRFARRCRQRKLPGSASGIVILILIVAATLTDVPAPGTALALGPLGTGKGGFQLRRRGHTQLATLQAGPHPPVAPAQPHRLDAPLRGGVGEAQLPHRVVEQAREPAPQCQPTAVDLVEMVEDVHFDAALIGGQALRPIFCNRSLRARHQSADRLGLRCRQAGQGEAAEHRRRRWAQGPLAGA